MDFKGIPWVAAVPAAVAGLVLGYWLLPLPLAVWLEPLSAWSGQGQVSRSFPSLVLPSAQRDFGAVRQGIVLKAAFAARNAGNRRLILVEQGGACCGEAPDLPPIIVEPGRSAEVTMKVDTAQWYGRLHHKVHYTTNDPRLPRFALEATALVEATSSH